MTIAVSELSLPKSWIATKIGEICTKPQYGYTTKASQSGTLKLLRTTDITSGTIKWSEVPFCSENPLDAEKYLLHSDDIVISRAGSIGVSYLIQDPEQSVFASYLIRFKPLLVNKKLFKFFLDSPLYWRSISEKKLGIAVANINANKLKEIDFPLPPLAEQHRIVDKIEELFSDLDDGIASLKKAQQQLKIYRQAVLKWAFEGKLTAQWREEQKRQGKLESAETLLEQIKAERERRYQAALAQWQADVKAWEANGKAGKKPSKPKKPADFQKLPEEEINGLPSLPKEWGWQRLGNVADDVFDGPFGSNLKTRDYTESGVRVIRLENIGFTSFIDERKTYISEEKYRFLTNHTVCEGDLIFASFASDGIRATVLPQLKTKAIAKADCFCVRASQKNIDLKCLMYLVSSQHSYKQIKGEIHGFTRPRINTKQLKSLLVPICSVSEQNQIVEEIESRLSICDSLEATIAENLERAEALRQSILKQAFEGKLVPQDPNDEPASVLLERIQQERAKGKGGVT